MEVVATPSLASIPKCYPGWGAIPLAETGDLLQRLAISVLEKPEVIIWQGETPCPLSFSGPVKSFDFLDSRAWRSEEESLVVMALPLAYQKSWGCYDGLIGQYFGNASQTCQSSLAIQYVEHCLQRYAYAGRHVRFGMDENGQCYFSLPRHLLGGYNQPGEMQLELTGVAADDGRGSYLEVLSSGPFLTYRLNPVFREFLEEEGWQFLPGQSRAVGRDLRHLPQSFSRTRLEGEVDPCVEILQSVLAEILASQTPRLAATCYLLDHNLRRLAGVVEASAGMGCRKVGVAGLLLDMHGFQSRNELHFVPWQALIAGPDKRGGAGMVCLEQSQLINHLAELALVAA